MLPKKLEHGLGLISAGILYAVPQDYEDNDQP